MGRRYMINPILADFEVIIDSFMEDLNLSSFKMPIISVYKYPKDYPTKYVARLYDINVTSGVVKTRYIFLGDSLDEIHDSIPAGMTCFLPTEDDDDDKEMVETWI